MTIREQVKKHDQLSIEIKLEFPFSAIKKKRKKKSKYDSYYVDIFFFLPNALDVNKHTYSKESFYHSLKTYIRFTTPRYTLKQIVQGNQSPFSQLKNAMEDYLKLPNSDKADIIETQVKRFCSIFGTATRKAANLIVRKKDIETRQKAVNEFIDEVTKIRSNFQLLEPLVQKISSVQLTNIFHFADEYQSILLERNLFVLLAALEKKKMKCSKRYFERLKSLVLEEINHREKNNYPSVAYANKNNEYVLHRAARLKKFIESNLFLNTDTRKDGVILEQILFALAAGLAMVFATSVAFVSQMIYGNLTLPFFIALIISYMFKDRIKELVRIYLNKKQHKFVQDYKTNIYDQQSEKIGYLKESFGFVKHKHIPAAILTARNSMRVTEITNRTLGEKIILHRNRVKIFSRKVKSLQDFSGTTEILRINISDFTKNMDDPKKDVFVKTKKGFKRGSAKRSYHLNMILNYSDQDEERIKLYKLIVNRNGIQRIEKFKFDNREK